MFPFMFIPLILEEQNWNCRSFRLCQMNWREDRTVDYTGRISLDRLYDLT